MAGHEPIVWNVNFLTGVDEIDDQHRILVNTLNEANAKLEGNSSAEFLEQITRDLLSYALYHFETEEELMTEYGYGEERTEDAESHLQQHRSFSAKVVAVRDGLKAGTLISREDLLSFLNNWLVNHILHTDKRLGAFVAGKRAATAAAV
jgi:hemerythrin-like metal-binding protein